MYFNKNLNEVQYFDTKKNNTKIFFDLFNNKYFFDDVELIFLANMFKLYKKTIINDEEVIVQIFFEDSPLFLRRIIIKTSEINTSIYINYINLDPSFADNFFSLANPILNQ